MLNYNISFYIRSQRLQDGKAPIYLRVRIQKEKLEISTNQSIEPKNWNSTKQSVVKCPEATLINSLLNNAKSDVLKAITDLHLSKTEVTIENVRKLLKGDEVVENYSLLKLVEEHNINFEKQIGVQLKKEKHRK